MAGRKPGSVIATVACPPRLRPLCDELGARTLSQTLRHAHHRSRSPRPPRCHHAQRPVAAGSATRSPERGACARTWSPPRTRPRAAACARPQDGPPGSFPWAVRTSPKHCGFKARSPVPRQLQQGAADANGEPDCGDNAAFAALSAQVMHSCCPSPAPGAEEEAGSGECELPANCDSTECADEFLEFFDACYAQLSALSAAVFGRFDTFNTGCEARTRPHHHRTHPLAPYAERGVDILPAAARTPPRCHRSLPPRAHADVFPRSIVCCLRCV